MNMVERVARALANQEGYSYDPYPYNERAIAAIEAMREPTEEMVKIGTAYANWPQDGAHHALKRSGYSAMIDAALSPIVESDGK